MPWYRVVVTTHHEAYVDASSAASARADYTDYSFKQTDDGSVEVEPVTPEQATKENCPWPSEYPEVEPCPTAM